MVAACCLQEVYLVEFMMRRSLLFFFWMGWDSLGLEGIHALHLGTEWDSREHELAIQTTRIEEGEDRVGSLVWECVLFCIRYERSPLLA